jgi:tellurite resistance protein
VRLEFSIGFWAFTFAWAAVASVVLHWLVETEPTGHVAWAWLVLAAITILIGAIAVRSIAALVTGSLFPPGTAAAPAAAPAEPPRESPAGARGGR